VKEREIQLRQGANVSESAGADPALAAAARIDARLKGKASGMTSARSVDRYGEESVVVADRREGRIDRRMPRMQIYLPDAMYKQVKARGLPVSELLQKAVQAELRRQDLLAETDRYLTGLIAEVGAPSRAQRTRASAVARRLAQRPVRKVG